MNKIRFRIRVHFPNNLPFTISNMNNNQSKQELLLSSLLKFYEEDAQYLTILSKIAGQKTSISLREMDYTITNYGNKNKTVYKLKNGSMFNMYLEYKNQLKAYSKKFFDPFCRRERIFIEFEGLGITTLKDSEVSVFKERTNGIVTTVGQLNFFRWAITNEVIDFCFNNKAKIDQEMEVVSKKKHEQEIKVIIEFE